MEAFPWWSSRHIELAKEIEEFADEHAHEAVKALWKRKYPLELLDEVRRRGWFGALIPEEYGGLGLGATGSCIAAEGLGRLGTIAHVYTTTMFGGTEQIMLFGTEEQKERWLPRIAKGELKGAIVITEPYFGSDAAGIETVAVREGDEYVITGKKRFITNAGLADLYMLYARTSDSPEDRARYRHLTAFIVEKGMEGFSIERVNELCGWDGLQNGYLNLDEVRVPVDNRLGEEGDGWRIMVSGLNYERTLVAASALGPIRDALRYAVYHAQRRVQFNQPTISFQVNQFRIADMIAKLKTARLLTYYAAYLLDRGEEAVLEATAAKLYATEVMEEVTKTAVQVMGGDGWMKFYPVEQLYRDAKIFPIIGGTNEVMKIILFRQGLRALREELKPPVMLIDPELNAPLPHFKVKPAEPAELTEDKLLETLAEYYKANPGLYATLEELALRLGAKPEEIAKLALELEKKGLAKTYIDPRRKAVKMVRPTYKGLKKAKPLEYYKYMPSWVDQRLIF
ncbi:MAG: acyl-CoA dehydrogenase [Thermoproteota archaeon]|nr:MAG: acyl-CoA dehydrogenase [Candidatus Korarchaeota archaeon]